MVSIIDGSSRFTPTTCELAIEDQMKKYDAYDNENDTAAVVFIMDSLAPERSKAVRQRCNKDGKSPYAPIKDPFPVVWLHLLQEVAPVSYELYQKQVDDLKALTASSYPGENVTQLVQAWYELADPLDLAGHYQPNYTTHLITAALAAGGVTNDPDLVAFYCSNPQ